MRCMRGTLCLGVLIAGILASVPVRPACGGDPKRGYELLLEKPYLSSDFDEEIFSRVWEIWPEPLRSEAERATPLERRRMAFLRYGLTTRPRVNLLTTEDEKFLPLQYVVDKQGRWTMNCFSCHGGMLLGESIPGVPNNRFALQLMSEELRQIKQKIHPEPQLTRMEKASQLVPLGTTRGTTNAVMFGVLLMAMRDVDLNVKPPQGIPRIVHHDMDAPAWWIYRQKDYLYAEAYAKRNHRSLMQFMLIRSNGPEKFRAWDEDFKDIEAYLESIEPPKYPFQVNQALADRGRLAFENYCAECHGTYGAQASYPNRNVPIKEIGTDPVRYDALTPAERGLFAQSWFTDYGKLPTILDPAGYLAPPLDGIWASAPYFHNGSVPTLWHVLHPDQRPVVWKRAEKDDYDEERIGLKVEELKKVPANVTEFRDRMEYFDTTGYSKKASGHTFPNALSEDEKQAVLEYLKTL